MRVEYFGGESRPKGWYWADEGTGAETDDWWGPYASEEAAREDATRVTHAASREALGLVEDD